MKRKNEKGITLIALVITIIILLILAGVTIGFAINGNGLFDKAKYATETYNNKAKEEEIALGNLENEINTFTRAGSFTETLLFPATQDSTAYANTIGTEYTLNDSYTNYKYLLVEGAYLSTGNGSWMGPATTLIRTANIKQADVFMKQAGTIDEKLYKTWSIWFAGSIIGFYFNSNTSFKIGSQANNGIDAITHIYGLN